MKLIKKLLLSGILEIQLNFCDDGFIIVRLLVLRTQAVSALFYPLVVFHPCRVLNSVEVMRK